MTAFSNDTVAYQAIQRTLRNALVHFLRERLSGAFSDAAAEIEGLFTAEQWEAPHASLLKRLDGRAL